MTDDTELTQYEIKYALEQIQNLFRRGAKLTLVVRDPSAPGSALLFGDDLALRRVLAKYFASIGVRFNG